MELSQIKATVIREIDQRRNEIVEMSSRIHAYPELAFAEYKASEWLSAWLEENGFQVERGIVGLPTAFRASRTQGIDGPTVALLAEYDALPKIGHACGHNIIGTASAAAGIALGKVAEWLPGKVVVLGTPAEEGGGGKALMVERGAFDGIDAALIVHPGTRTRASSRALASVTVDVEFVGRAAHAAARPEEGINALDALILSYNNINALRQHMRADARIHGIITNGGEAPNVVPALAAGRFYVRAMDDSYLDSLLERVIDCFRAGGQATGANFSYRISEVRYAPMRSNCALERAFSDNLVSLGVAVEPPEASTNRGCGSTDVGNVSQVVPSIHPSIAIAPEPVLTHSPEFAIAAVSEQGHLGLLNAAKALAMTAVDLLLNPELMARVREEFTKASK